MKMFYVCFVPQLRLRCERQLIYNQHHCDNYSEREIVGGCWLQRECSSAAKMKALAVTLHVLRVWLGAAGPRCESVLNGVSAGG